MPTPLQRKQLRDALISAFPNKSLLEQLLYFELDKNLNEITKDSDLQEIAFRLIQTASSQGWLEGLVSAARTSNPGNQSLQAVAQELLTEPNFMERKASSPDPSLGETHAIPGNEQPMPDDIDKIIEQLKKVKPEIIVSSSSNLQEVISFIMDLWNEAKKISKKRQFAEAAFLLEFGIATCKIIDDPILWLALDKELEFIKAKLS